MFVSFAIFSEHLQIIAILFSSYYIKYITITLFFFFISFIDLVLLSSSSECPPVLGCCHRNISAMALSLLKSLYSGIQFFKLHSILISLGFKNFSITWLFLLSVYWLSLLYWVRIKSQIPVCHLLSSKGENYQHRWRVSCKS